MSRGAERRGLKTGAGSAFLRVAADTTGPNPNEDTAP